MKHIYSFSLFTLIALGCYAQQGQLTEQMGETEKMIYHEHLSYNKQNNESLGYRVRIFRDNDQNAKTKATETARRLRELYPDLPKPYLRHVEPYFIVSVGDYRTKDQALKTLLRIKKSFPKAFISHIEPIKTSVEASNESTE